ncbi:patronin-like isoform X5 [Daphnia pulicaria]|uniref:patronin-like isoform X5 n=1 Tax=Daphnia pulicaria TaxID=35523 RepID=UPI001EECE40B|nr:patronin-like isoform X5 [Daphnia pulicaria]
MESRSSSSARMRTLTYMPVVEVQGYNAHNKLQAKQRASVQWLLSKSYSHQVPEDVKEPFYRDVEDQEYLKPSVVHALANAELYCLALAHIYADPNYSQLNHWGVIQALARKGVYVAEPSDVALTETTLIHTSPLRMSAHMAVMEGIMNLFVKEVVSAERVVAAIRRFADLDASQTPAPKEAEQALLLWITKACQSLKKRLTAEVDGHGEDVPNFPELRELGDLSDGMSLLGLLAFYAPDLVDWTRIATNEPFSMADCLYNLELVHKFCSESLPNNIFHLGLEDIVYMHSSVRQNVLAFLADLFYILEVRPAKCIRPPGLMRDRFPINEGKSNAIRRQGSLQERDRTKRQTVHEDSNLSTRNNLYPDWWWPCQHGPTDQCHYCRPSYATLWSHHAHRQQQKHRHHQHQCHQHTADSDVMEQGKSANSPQIGTPQMSGSPRRRMDQLEQSQQQLQQPDGGDESFVVHRGKTVPTLYNVVTGGEGATPRGSRVAAIKERFNMDTKAEERGEDRSSSSSGPAGVPSNWEDRKSGTSYAGRRSRRNSITDDSHLTIENFGGSQDNLSMFGRNPDKEPATVQQSGRRPSIDAFTPDSIPPTAGTPSTPAGVNYWRRNNDRTRSQENLSDYLMDNRDVEEQLDRRSRASSPTYSSISSTAKSGSHNGNKQFVIIAANPSEPADLYEDPRVNLARATNFAELSKLRESLGSNSAINIVYMQQDKDPIQSAKGSAVGSPVSQHGRRISENQRKLGGGITIAEAMSSTSWEPQTPVVDKMDGRLEALMPDDMNSTTDLYSIRLKMEEKRKRIESDKRQQELLANRQREKVGKAAFLQAVAKGKGNADGRDGGHASPVDYYSAMESPSRSHHPAMPPPQQQQQQHQPHQLPTPDYEMPDYDFLQRHQQQQHHQQQQQQQQHHGMPYDPYRMGHPIQQQQSPMNGGGAGGMDPNQPGQFYLHEPSPTSRRTWGQPQPISPAPPPPSMVYRPDDMLGYGMPPQQQQQQQQQQQPRRAQWGTPQPVRAMMGHHGYMMNPNTGNYMDAHGPPQGGYMMQTPPRHPMDNPYDAQQHYYANGSQFNQPDPQDPYYYSPARTQQPHPMQQQPPQQQQPPPQPHYQQQQQGYGGPPAAGSPHGYPAPSPQHNYPSAADQRAPFRLHAPNDLAAEPVVLRSPAHPKQQAEIPELHRGSVHNQQQPPKVQQPEQRPQSATITRPVPATRTITPIRSSVPSNGGGQSSSSTSAAGSPIGSGGVFHAAMPTPSIDDMEPQNVSFIETPSATGADGVDEADLQLPRRLRNLNITSGNRTYRIPHEATQSSPPRPALLKTFRASPSPSSSSPVSPSPSSVYLAPQPNSSGSESPDEAVLDEGVKTAKLKENVEADRGFIITFDDVATGPKRPKPQLGAKRQPSPKKLSTYSAPSETTPVSSSPAYNHNNKSGSSREGSPRRSLSSMARENRDDYSPFTPDSRDSGFGQNSQEELKLFNMATAIPGTLPGSDRTLRDYDSQDDENPTGLVIGDELVNPDPDAMDEMERKKEKILMQSLRRKQQQEEARQRKEQDALQRKEEERSKEEEKQRKKEDEKARRAIIFEQYKIKKAMEEAEKEGRPYEMPDQMGSKSGPKMRSKNNNSTPSRPRPKTIHVESGPPESYTPHSRAVSTMSAMSSKGKRGSGNNLTENRNDSRGDGVRGSNPTLSRRGSNSSLHGDSQTPNRYRTMERGHSGRKDLSVPRYGQSGGSTRNSREDLYGSRNYRGSNSSLNDADSYEAYHTPLVHSGRKGSGFMTGGRQADATVMAATAAAASARPAVRSSNNLILRRSGSLMDFSDGDAGVGGRANPPSRRISPAVTPTSTPFRRFPSPSGPGSLPPGLVSKRRGFDDGASDVSSNQDYIGPRLYKQPAARSNRSIILNAVEYCVFPGVVNREAKQRVLEEITRSESKNFLVLFRDGGLTFRALYSFNPEKEEIIKMYGTGPKLVNDTMFEKFFKYNSGGKCFSQVHTKHLTVTIDAFTIHAGLWQGKKQSLPNKKDMTLVI